MRAACAALALATSIGLVFACADSESEPGLDREAGPGDPPASDARPDVTDASVTDAPARTCSNDGWCHTALPSKTTLKAIWGDAAGVVWAVGDRGDVLRWDGDAWKLHAKLDGALTAIWGSGETDLWIAGSRGLFHGTGASSSSIAFARVETPGDPLDVVQSIWGTGPNDVWAVGGRSDVGPHSGRVLHFAGRGDAAPAWALEDVGARDVAFSLVWGSAKSGVWITGVYYDEPNFESLGRLRRRPAGASAFVAVPLPEDPQTPGSGAFGFARAVSMNDRDLTLLGDTLLGVASAWRGASADDGKTFTFTLRAGDFSDQTWRAVSQTSADDVWASGDYGRLRHWNGTEWMPSAITLDHLPVVRPLYAMWRTAGGDLWVVGEEIAMRRDMSPKD